MPTGTLLTDRRTSNGHKRILIFDDEILIVHDVQSRLRAQGYDADGYSTCGAEAVAITGKVHPDLVLMDIRLLPGGMDGIQAAAEIRDKFHLPIVYLTGTADDESLARAKETAPDGYILKPFRTRELVVAVELALHRHFIHSTLHDSHRWLTTTIASIGDGVIATDRHGTIQVANPAALLLVGAVDDHLVGQDVRSVIVLHKPEDPESMENPVDTLAKTGQTVMTLADVRLKTRNEGLRPVDVTAATIWNGGDDAAGFTIVYRDIGERKMTEQVLRYLAYHDNLTGLPNRLRLLERIEVSMAQCRRHSRRLAILFLDLDDFKTVNDTLGHEAGDKLLRALAGRLTETVRFDDTAARLAGDEFIIVLSDIAAREDVERTAHKLLEAVGHGFEIDGHTVHVTGSIGIAIYPDHGTNVDDLMRYADTAMYLAKQAGKNACSIYNGDWKAGLTPLGDALE